MTQGNTDDEQPEAGAEPVAEPAAAEPAAEGAPERAAGRRGPAPSSACRSR